MANALVEDLDFFDQKVYSADVERLEPDDEEDVDPAEFEKKKYIFVTYFCSVRLSEIFVIIPLLQSIVFVVDPAPAIQTD